VCGVPVSVVARGRAGTAKANLNTKAEWRSAAATARGSRAGMEGGAEASTKAVAPGMAGRGGDGQGKGRGGRGLGRGLERRGTGGGGGGAGTVPPHSPPRAEGATARGRGAGCGAGHGGNGGEGCGEEGTVRASAEEVATGGTKQPLLPPPPPISIPIPKVPAATAAAQPPSNEVKRSKPTTPQCHP
jgi:hypothetical protein